MFRNMKINGTKFNYWRAWCRLCAKTYSTKHKEISLKLEECSEEGYSLEQQILAKTIERHFGINIKHDEAPLPTKLCDDCYILISKIGKFASRVIKVQQMFHALAKIPENSFIDYKAIRQKYGLFEETEFQVNAEECTSEFSELPSDTSKDNTDNIEAYIKNPLELPIKIEDHSNLDKPATLEVECDEDVETFVEIIDDDKDAIDEENHEDPAIFKCTECQGKFQRKSNYRVHMQRAHSIILPANEYHCSQCSKVFKILSHLKRHAALHTPLEKRKVFPCDHCELMLSSKYALQKHLQTHTKFTDESQLKEDTQSRQDKEEYLEISDAAENSNELDEHIENIEVTTTLKIEINHDEKRVTKSNDSEFNVSVDMADMSNEILLQTNSIDDDEEEQQVVDEAGKDENDSFRPKQNADGTITCPKCPRIFKLMHNFRTHMERTHLSVILPREFPCPQCTQIFYGNYWLKKHLLRHKPLDERSVHQCVECGKKFETKQAVQRHMMVHTNEAPYKCELCPLSCHRKIQLITHMRKCHATQNKDAEKINTNTHDNDLESCNNRSSAVNELESAEDLIACSQCSRYFDNMASYRRHMRRKHSTILPKTKLKCSKCRRTFASNKSLQLHAKKHDLPLEELKIFQCQHCNLTFRDQYSARKHERRIHLNERGLICEECGMELSSTSALRVHMMKHKGETPFKCEICNRGYREKNKLRIHMDRHDVNKKSCHICGRQFNSRLNLNCHMAVHSDDKRFKCDYCGKAFKRSKTLKTHLLLHTGLKPYSCNFCDRTFSTISSCRLHKKTLHPVELAALEAAGGGLVYACDVPSMEALKTIAQTSTNLRPVGYKENKLKV